MKFNILIILIISLFINELRAVNCPNGAAIANGQSDTGAADINTCTHCQKHFYFNGGNPAGQAPGAAQFNPGVSQCIACQVHKADSQHRQGGDANLAAQCSNLCPAGTAVEDGQPTFTQSLSQCVNCKANFYFNGGNPTGQAPGAGQFDPTQLIVNPDNNPEVPNVSGPNGQCVACQVNKSDSQLRPGAQANLATQCNNECPTGTAIQDGAIFIYTQSISQCTFCKVDFYFNGGNPSAQNPGNGQFTPGQLIVNPDAATVAQIPMVPGPNSKCVACESKKTNSQSRSGLEANLAAQCGTECPAGTLVTDGVTPTYTVSLSQCVNCKAGFYQNSNFEAGKSQCNKCAVSKTGSASVPGNSATSATQCQNDCPAGTVVDDGTSTNFVALASECTKCQANFYASKTSGFAAGTDTCTECSKKLTSGATAKLYAEATQKAQCASSTFAKFLSMSLIFISFYLL
ncbi:immobilization antigen variant b protein, putative [Ichthyophthirius multifiliis]|uniref:Immobilization antigen variant b protein, putative n=1 Tax=Ichthyophthirius multifiliis TaxID=5932 RepID=G0QJ27_ICHMU|nr:immobilization antigen variant b protein, putative [Ichthyophthirius multifiliis]EGR34780.1 immobilization antigen variant b protein, putative [Ichthyophthirius multifiliis]|eukprot:XP_004040084.1 immobilization antigen variant b protein, putative [Ichthyophthirius multifiliis]